MAIIGETKFVYLDAMTSAYLQTQDVIDLNRQGQFAGFKLPVALARLLGVALQADPDEPQRKRLVDEAGQRWRVVVGGPEEFLLVRSEMHGKGRFVDPDTHAAEQTDLAGYVLADVSEWPTVRVIVRGMAGLQGVERIRRTTFDRWFYGSDLPLE